MNHQTVGITPSSALIFRGHLLEAGVPKGGST